MLGSPHPRWPPERPHLPRQKLETLTFHSSLPQPPAPAHLLLEGLGGVVQCLSVTGDLLS